MTVSITAVDWQAHREKLLAIRVAVFVEEQGVPSELEHDEHDADALHVLATDDRYGAIGTGRLLANGHIGRMAVLASHRGQGIGGDMLRALLDIAAQRDLPQVFLNAQCSAVPFYERHGFIAEGDVFIDAGIDHRRMCRLLNR
ncbi:MAG: GNAT family N-acetyltransferase [Gammaproteobacteria bacterium]|nr:GNAT family N-acetyltransferase [Gammaproteobacteria bacterium]MCP5299804.1 GNAT family N-acetyltransferase [Chromatiaceae bacterium]